MKYSKWAFSFAAICLALLTLSCQPTEDEKETGQTTQQVEEMKVDAEAEQKPLELPHSLSFEEGVITIQAIRRSTEYGTQIAAPEGEEFVIIHYTLESAAEHDWPSLDNTLMYNVNESVVSSFYSHDTIDILDVGLEDIDGNNLLMVPALTLKGGGGNKAGIERPFLVTTGTRLKTFTFNEIQVDLENVVESQ